MLGIGRIFRAIGAQLRKISRAIWKADPAAIIEAEIEIQSEKIRKGESALAEYRGNLTKLERQVKAANDKVATADRMVKLHLTKGDEAGAKRYISQLQIAKTEQAQFTAQHDALDKNYKLTVANMKAAANSIAAAKQKAESMKVQLKVSEASAAAADLISGLTEINNGIGMSDFSEATEMMQSQIDKNNAKIQVASDLGIDGVSKLQEQATVADMEADALLAQYKIDAGLIGDPTSTTTASKQIGPELTA